ncbi:hypothetical protein H257_15494 [Aphanomyces astaci]|uniref:Ubiquitin-like domain-containing protein n=1 Tax=Aphanomyces astaci TaxID=112090 RepID=W4FLZ1_APHAT|nr:hypothetical protein H257_15494 [Aphanomyces astaci]ETV68490.1 hypothetical protein H257_15494 [Aphanomyces astaci]|eukprot:XP_009841919.1 hypothetical protein H257_15494 [Aphanomyces astaci]
MYVQVFVKRTNGDDGGSRPGWHCPTVLAFKEELQDVTGVAPPLQRVVVHGKFLQNDQTLRSYDVVAGQTLYIASYVATATTSRPPAPPSQPPWVFPVSSSFRSFATGNPSTAKCASVDPVAGGGKVWWIAPPTLEILQANPVETKWLVEFFKNVGSNAEILQHDPDSLDAAAAHPALLRQAMTAIYTPATMRDMQSINHAGRASQTQERVAMALRQVDWASHNPVTWSRPIQLTTSGTSTQENGCFAQSVYLTLGGCRQLTDERGVEQRMMVAHDVGNDIVANEQLDQSSAATNDNAGVDAALLLLLQEEAAICHAWLRFQTAEAMMEDIKMLIMHEATARAALDDDYEVAQLLAMMPDQDAGLRRQRNRAKG